MRYWYCPISSKSVERQCLTGRALRFFMLTFRVLQQGSGSASGRQREWLVVDKEGNCSFIVVGNRDWQHARASPFHSILTNSLLKLAAIESNLSRHHILPLSQVDKHELVANLGIHYRDLRIVDPHVPTPYPSGIFTREKAIVLNLESLRCTAQCRKRTHLFQLTSDGTLIATAVPSVQEHHMQGQGLHPQCSQPWEAAELRDHVDGRQLFHKRPACQGRASKAWSPGHQVRSQPPQ